MDTKLLRILLVIFFSTCFCGILSSWGFMAPYMCSYLRLYDPSITTLQINFCLYAVQLGELFSGFIIERTFEVLGYKKAFRLGIICNGVCTILCAYSTSLYFTLF